MDKTINEIEMKEVKLDITWDDICDLCAGIDETGEPRSSACLLVDNIKGEEPDVKESRSFKRAIMGLYIRGGCAIITASFPKSDIKDALGINHAVVNYYQNMIENEKSGDILELLLVPYGIDMGLVAVFRGLVYTDFSEDENEYRLIFAFDHQMSFVLTDNEIDMYHLYDEVRAVIAKSDARLDDQLDAALKDQEAAERELQDYYTGSGRFRDGGAGEYLTGVPQAVEDTDDGGWMRFGDDGGEA